MDGPPEGELAAIRSATFTVPEIEEREKVTDHDTAAFVDVLSASAGPAGRWIHYGLTSSDVLDTGLALQLRRVSELVLPDARRLVDVLAARAREHVHTLCVGRTHGIHAEPTTFGTEVSEVREPFGAGQKGSSAMPHKRNPIKSEQVAGLARVLRGNALAALEDVALWHERDISHSSVERIILPDSTALLDHLQRRVLALAEGMVVDARRMREN